MNRSFDDFYLFDDLRKEPRAPTTAELTQSQVAINPARLAIRRTRLVGAFKTTGASSTAFRC
jgi:hypothetical protein